MTVQGEVIGMKATAGATAIARDVLQVAAMMQIALIAGATFGIWRGLGGASFSAATFIDVHQQLVHGLNVLLPAMGAAFAVLTAVLAYLARQRRPAFHFYLAALAFGIAAALLTRFWNQPINAQVMNWTPRSAFV